MSAFESNYARIVVWHNDPRDLQDKLTGRSFRIEVLHRAGENDPDQKIDDILIEGTVDDLVGLLNALDPNRVESRATLSVVGKLQIDSDPFNLENAVHHLRTNANPLTSFVTDVSAEEIRGRLQRWQEQREQGA